MEPPGGRDSRFQLGYSMNLLSGETPPEIYGGSLGRPSTSLQQLSPRHTMVSSACGGRGSIKSDVCYDERMTPQHGMGFEASGVNDIHDEPYNSLQSKKSPPSNGKKTKGRVKIKMEYIENKLRRYTTFSKRKTGIMKKAYELSTLTGTQVMLLVASETGHVYTFATRKLQPMITSEAGKALIQTCLNSPDPPVGSAGGDQRMSATGFEETELTYNISDEDSKENTCNSSDEEDFDDDTSDEDGKPPKKVIIKSEPVTLDLSDNQSESKIMSTQEGSESGDVDKREIISQINQINNALIQSNKAKAVPCTTTVATTTTSNVKQSGSTKSFERVHIPSSTVSPRSAVSSDSLPRTIQLAPSAIPPQLTVQPVGDVKAIPVIVQTENGLGFASVSDGMILGMIQGSLEPKFVAIPLSSAMSQNTVDPNSVQSVER